MQASGGVDNTECGGRVRYGGNSEPKRGQRSQSARGFSPRDDVGTVTRLSSILATQMPCRSCWMRWPCAECRHFKTAPYRARHHVYQIENTVERARPSGRRREAPLIMY